MRLKRLIVSAFAIAAVVGSLASSAVSVGAVDSPTSAPVTEVGSFSFSLWGPGIAFTPAGVSSSISQNVNLAWPNDSYPHRVLMVNDQYAYNPTGFSLSISASNLTSGSYFIDNSNLSVKNVGGGSHSSCLTPYAPHNTVVGGNAYQTITYSPSISTYASLDSSLGIVSGSTGRGCREFQINLDFKLHVPAGTYTAGGTATYTGNVTITHTMAP